MKRLLLLLLLCMSGWVVRGQSECRYWFDQNQASIVSSTSANSSWTIPVDAGGLQAGFHTLYLQVRNGTSPWDAPMSYVFYKPKQSSSADVYQCWFDQNYANAQTGMVGTGFTLDVSALLPGFHTVYIRISHGMEEQLQSFIFYKSPLPNSTDPYQCWFDQNYANAQTGIVGTGFALDASTLLPGFHTAYIRISHEAKEQLQSFIFYKPSLSSSTDVYQCWFDQNYASRQTGAVGTGFNINVSALQPGFHTLYTRIGENTKTQLQSFIFYKQRDGDCSSYTCWIDEDESSSVSGMLGNGNILLDVSGLDGGTHIVNIRLCSGDSMRVETYEFTAPDPPRSLPYCDDFESTEHLHMPEGWSTFNEGECTTHDLGRPRVYQGIGYEGSKELDFFSPCLQAAVLPHFTISDIRSVRISCKAKSSNAAGCYLRVGVMADPTDLSTFVDVDTLRCTSTEVWEDISASLARYQGAGDAIALWFVSDGADRGCIYVDNLWVTDCPWPEIAASDTSLTLTTNIPGTVDYYVEYGQQGFTPGSGTMLHVTSDSVVLTGLQPNTFYDLYPRRNANDIFCGVPITLQTLRTPVNIGGCDTFLVSDGQNTDAHVPVYGLYTDAPQMTQSIYPASMLTSFVGLTIDSIHYSVSSGSSNRWSNGLWIIKIGITTQDNLANGFDRSTALTEVYNGTLNATVEGGMGIRLDEPFTYTGGNLLVQFELPAETGWSSCSFYGNNADNASRYAYGYSYSTSTGSRVNFLPALEVHACGNTPVVINTLCIFDTVASGTNTSSHIPVNGSNGNQRQRSQVIYPAEMLTDLVGKRIDSLQYFVSSGSSSGWGDGDWTIRMGITRWGIVYAAFDNNTVLTEVYHGPLTANGSTGMGIRLDSSFAYAGGNLLIEFIQNNSSANSSCSFYGTSVYGGSRYSSSSSGNIRNVFGNTEAFIPQTAFHACNDSTIDTTHYLNGVALPYCENFDNYPAGEGNMPLYWGGYNTFNWDIGRFPHVNSGGGRSPNNLLCLRAYSSNKCYAIFPHFTVDSIQQLNISFYIRRDATDAGMLIIGVLTDSTNVNTFIPLDTILPAERNVWIPVHYSFANYHGPAQRGAFLDVRVEGSAGNLAIDDFVATGWCGPTIEQLNTNVLRSVVAESDSVNYWLEYGPEGFSPGNDASTLVHVTTSPYYISNLTPGVNYDFYAYPYMGNTTLVRSTCQNPLPIQVAQSCYTFSDTTASACDSLFWHGHTYHVSGNYNDTIITTNNCDSVVTLNLTINYSNIGTEILSACDSYTWIDGNTYTTSTSSPTLTLTNIDGCDSNITLDLTINHSNSYLDSIIAIDSCIWRGRIYTAGGITNDTLNNISGCDSIIELNITIIHTGDNNIFSIGGCKKVRFSKGNLQYQASTGKWRFAEHQYDYIGNGNSNASASYNGWIDLFYWACSGWNGGIDNNYPWSTSNSYYYHPNNVTGMDLVDDYANADWAYYNAIENGGNQPGMWRTPTGAEWEYIFFTRSASTIGSVANARYTKATVNGVKGLILFPDNYIYPSSLPVPAGINSSNFPFSSNIFTLEQWTTLENAGAVFLPAGGARSGATMRQVQTYGLYWTSSHYNGYLAKDMWFSDSNVEAPGWGMHGLGMSIRPIQDALNVVEKNVSACDSIQWNDSTLYSSGAYLVDTTSTMGCDSISILLLTINHSTIEDTNITACDSILWNGTTFRTSGNNIATHHTASTNNCDSTVTLHLTINHSTSAIETVTACNSFVWHGTEYTESTSTPTHNTTNAAGCDSITTLHLTVNHCSTTTLIVCDSLSWHGGTYTSSGIYTISTDTLNLTVNHSSIGTDTQISCDTYTWIDGLTYTASNNTATHTLTNAAGCDSTVTLDLTIIASPSLSHSPDTSLLQGSNLTLWASGADILSWTDTSGSIQANDSTFAITPLKSSVYVVTAANEGVNLVYNGDFELGNTGFTTSHTYNSHTNEGAYYIGTDARNQYPSFAIWHDHTSGNGQYMIVNGAGNPNANVWTQTIPVEPNTDYAFSSWICNLSPRAAVSGNLADVAQLQFSINGSQLGDIFYVPEMAGWVKVYEVWNSGNNSSATITILNQNSGWAGNDFGIDDIHFSSLATCAKQDSVKVRIYSVTEIDSSVCDNNLPFVWQGQTITAGGIYRDTVANIYGDDSIVVLNLTVRLSSTSTFEETIVENQLPYTFNGQTFTDSTSLTLVTIPNNVGCDSTISYTLHIQWNTGSRLDSNVCFNQLPVTWNNTLFDTTVANTTIMRTVVIPSVSGSDSTIIMRLHVRPIYNDTIPYSICDNQTHTFEGTVYGGTDAGFHSHMLHTATYGCDSLRVLNLEVRPTTTGDTVADHCDHFTWYGTEYTASTNTPTHLSSNAVNCDSTTTLHLTIRYSSTSSIEETIVENQLPYTFNGQTFTDSTDLTLVTIPNNVGCDSTISYTLHIQWNTGSRLDSNVCFNQLPVTWNNALFDTTVANTTIMRTVVIPSVSGSDSTIIMRLHVRPIYNDTIPYSICDNQTHTFEGTVYGGTDAGFHPHMLHTATYGCDSLRVLNLEVRPTTTGDTVANHCDSFIWYGTEYTASTDTPTHLSSNAVNCDSTTTLHLTIRYSSTSSIEETIVENQLPYTFNGQTFTDSTDLTLVTIPNAVGCDSTINYTLHIQWNTGSRLDSNVCFNQLPVTWNNTLFDTTVANTTIMRTVVIPSVSGSDSTIIMRLHVRPIHNDTISYSICDNQTHTFEGTVYGGTDAGFHPHMLHTDAYGCDSLRVLNLEVRPTTTGDTVANHCDSFTWYGTEYTTSTDTPTHLSSNAVNCDSTTTLHLTIRYSTTGVEADTVIENLLPYSYHDSTFADSISHVAVVFPNTVQCDSVVDFTLFVHRNVDTTLYDTVCNDALPLTWNGIVFDTLVGESTTMTRATVFTAHTGADSTITMHLTVHALYDHHTTVAICDNQQYTFGDSTFVPDATLTHNIDTSQYIEHLDSLLSIHGCDSLSTLHLTSWSTYDHHLSDTVCTNHSYTWGTPQRGIFAPGSVTASLHSRDTTVQLTILDSHFPADTLVTDHLASAHSCDSLSSLHLHLLPSYDLHFSDTICNAEWAMASGQWVPHSYPFEDTTYSTTGSYPHLLSTLHSPLSTQPHSCDSTRTLHLKVWPTYDQHLYDTIYDGDHYTFEGTVYDTTGVYLHRLDAVFACDSLRTLHLQRNRRTYNDSNLCQNALPLVWNGVTFADRPHTGGMLAMSDSVHLSGLNGIDSLVVMTVYAHDTSSTVDLVHGCDSLTWQDGHTYHASTTTPFVTLTNRAQCDSVVHLALTVDYTHYYTDRHVVCDSMRWINNSWYYRDTAGVVDTFRTIADCDSVVTLDLTVHYSTSTALHDTICYNDTYYWHGFTIHSTAVYRTEDFPLTDTLRTIHGCDSVVGMIVTKMALPQVDLVHEIDCAAKGYRIIADARAPFSPDSDPQPMPYLLWNAVPIDDALEGQERQTVVKVAPQSLTEYMVFVDYRETPFCPTTARLTLRPVIIDTASVKVNPQILTYDNLSFDAYDLTTEHARSQRPGEIEQWQRTWYVDGVRQWERDRHLAREADAESDSVIVALEVYNGICYDTALTVIPIRRVALFAPNIFTPLEADNNRFVVVTTGVIDAELYIYNREGLLVYYTSDLSHGWDGRTNDGKICPQGNYVWRLNYHATDRPHHLRTEVGSVILLK